MHDPQLNQRIAAARAFKESLDQLEDILAQERPKAKSNSSAPPDTSAQHSIDLKMLEEAAADLDAFFGEDLPWEDEE